MWRIYSNTAVWLLQLEYYITVCFCCASCRSGTRRVRSASGRAWWSTTTAASTPSSLCTTWPASHPSTVSPSGSRNAADTAWGPWCRASWWETSVIWGTAGRSPRRPPSVSLTDTTSRCLRPQPKTLLRRSTSMPFFWRSLIGWRVTNLWDWSSCVRAVWVTCGTRESRKKQLVNAKVNSILYGFIWRSPQPSGTITMLRNAALSWAPKRWPLKGQKLLMIFALSPSYCKAQLVTVWVTMYI